MISGVSTEELQFLQDLSPFIDQQDQWNQWTGLKKDDTNFLDSLLTDVDLDLDVEIPEFHDLDEITVQSLDVMEKDEVPKSTSSQTLCYSTKFKDYLNSKGLPNTIESMPLRYLSQYLRLFYSSLKKDDNTYYAPATLGCIRAAINRYLTSAPWNRQINII